MQAAALVTKTLPSGVLRVSMCRPKANAMTVGLMEALSAALHDAAASSSVRGVVVTSELPKTFSAGLDVTEVHDLVRGRDRAGLQQYFTAMDTAFRAAPRCPKPVVAALDGHAVAGTNLTGSCWKLFWCAKVFTCCSKCVYDRTYWQAA